MALRAAGSGHGGLGIWKFVFLGIGAGRAAVLGVGGGHGCRMAASEQALSGWDSQFVFF